MYTKVYTEFEDPQFVFVFLGVLGAHIMYVCNVYRDLGYILSAGVILKNNTY